MIESEEMYETLVFTDCVRIFLAYLFASKSFKSYILRYGDRYQNLAGSGSGMGPCLSAPVEIRMVTNSEPSYRLPGDRGSQDSTSS